MFIFNLFAFISGRRPLNQHKKVVFDFLLCVCVCERENESVHLFTSQGWDIHTRLISNIILLKHDTIH